MATINSNSASFLKRAGELINGEIATAASNIKSNQEALVLATWEAVCNLICHAQINVFKAGYKKSLAAEFRVDVSKSLSISEKQAGKYTESISAALGWRVTKGAVKRGGIKGLQTPAMDSPGAVAEFLKEMDITTLGELRSAIRKESDPLQDIAKKLAKLEETERKEVLELVKKLDAAAALAANAGDAAHKVATNKANKSTVQQAAV